MKTDKFTLFVYCNFLVLLSTSVCSQNINKQIVNIADETLIDYSFLIRYHYTKSKNYLKRRNRIRHLIPMFFGTPCKYRWSRRFLLCIKQHFQDVTHNLDQFDVENWYLVLSHFFSEKNTMFRYCWESFAALFNCESLIIMLVKLLNFYFYDKFDKMWTC